MGASNICMCSPVAVCQVLFAKHAVYALQGGWLLLLQTAKGEGNAKLMATWWKVSSLSKRTVWFSLCNLRNRQCSTEKSRVCAIAR